MELRHANRIAMLGLIITIHHGRRPGYGDLA
jgi:hypothetical protein